MKNLSDHEEILTLLNKLATGRAPGCRKSVNVFQLSHVSIEYSALKKSISGYLFKSVECIDGNVTSFSSKSSDHTDSSLVIKL